MLQELRDIASGVGDGGTITLKREHCEALEKLAEQTGTEPEGDEDENFKEIGKGSFQVPCSYLRRVVSSAPLDPNLSDEAPSEPTRRRKRKPKAEVEAEE